MAWISDPNVWLSLLTLCALEIVLGIDNIIFISIITNKLPVDQQARGRRLGLLLALVLRIALLCSLSWMMRLTEPLVVIGRFGFSGRDLILLAGGLFLMYKSVKEIHGKVEETKRSAKKKARQARYASIVLQIMLADLVFSLDSVITAVGMVNQLEIMIAAVVVSVGLMLIAAAPISRFVNRHPTVKILALAFLIMVGMALVGEAFHFHIPKGYIYFAMAFSIGVEFINIRLHHRPGK